MAAFNTVINGLGNCSSDLVFQTCIFLINIKN